MNVAEAAQGSRRDLLVALRDVLAAAMDKTTSGRDLVSLSKQLLDVVREIHALDLTEEPAHLRLVPDEPWDGAAL